MTSTVFKDLVGPPVNAAWLNDVNNYVYEGIGPNGQPLADTLTYNEGMTGAVTRTIKSKLQESVSVMDFGAAGDGLQDDTDYIQAAINAVYNNGGGTVLVPAGHTFMVSVKSYAGLTGAASIILKSNVTLQLEGTIKIFDSAYGAGAYFAIIRTLDAGGSNIRITGRGTIDGNRSNQVASVQCSNIMLKYAISNIVVEGINSINANGMGIQVVGANPAAGSIGGCENVRISGTTVDNCSYIGIQCAQFNNLRIENNYVSFTTDNAIDVYGENNGSTVASGTNFVISGNTCRNCLTGVFAETVAVGTISGNNIYLSPVNVGGSGIHINRINGEPYGINVTGNSINNIETGVLVTGDTGGVFINNNVITGFSAGGVTLGAGGNCSYVDVSNNFFKPNNNTTGIVNITGTQLAFITGRFNTVDAAGIATSYLAYVNATTVVNVHVDSFRTLPYQYGSDLNAILPSFGTLQMFKGTFENVSTAQTITVSNQTGGVCLITARQNGVGTSSYSVPFVKDSNGVLALGTPTKAYVTADPITSVTISGNNIVVTPLAANTYIAYAIQYTPTI